MVPVEAWQAAAPSLPLAEAARPKPLRTASQVFSSAEQTAEAIAAAVARLANMEMNSEEIVKHTRQFGRDQFLKKMRAHIDGLLAERWNTP
jgi:hypothetical protein